jgi:hypothetical protein
LQYLCVKQALHIADDHQCYGFRCFEKVQANCDNVLVYVASCPGDALQHLAYTPFSHSADPSEHVEDVLALIAEMSSTYAIV